MTIFEVIEKAKKTEINEKKVRSVESVFGEIYSEMAKKLISLELDCRQIYSYYEDTWVVQVLSPLEMVSYKDYLDEVCPEKELIPFVAWGELDMICYDSEEDEWVDLELENCEIVQSEIDIEDIAQSLHDGLPELCNKSDDF